MTLNRKILSQSGPEITQIRGFRALWRLAALVATATGALAANEPPTFYRNVLPLLQNRCQTCHRAGEIAPMPLGTYRDVRPWARAIAEAVVSRRMPPWPADPAHGTFANDRRMPQAEIDTLSAWVARGAPEGDPADAPVPRSFPSGWSIGTPDAVFEMPQPFAVPAEGTVEYQYVLVPTWFAEDRWVEKVEVQPGDRRLVHHAVVFAREPEARFLRQLRPGVPLPLPEPRSKPSPDNEAGVLLDTPGAEVLGVYVPGGSAWNLEPGRARLLRAGSDLVFQIHYTTRGVAGSDRSRVGVTFARTAPKERVRNVVIANPYLEIPPGAADHPVAARATVQSGVQLLSLFPHMHLRGKSFEYRAVFPDGRSEILLRVPKYDFDWQLTYVLAQPRVLPAGTVLECLARYDNSASNARNPDPRVRVRWGDQSWEEMLAGFMDIAFDPRLDPAALLRPVRSGASRP